MYLTAICCDKRSFVGIGAGGKVFQLLGQEQHGQVTR